MSIIELFIIAVGLSMDAFAVSIGKGLSVSKIKLSHALKVGVWFGGFQALMPLIGYFLGSTFASVVTNFDHWVAFFLLGIIGFNMIRDSFSKEEDEDKPNADFSFKVMLMLAVATSIDALAVGVSFAFLCVKILPAVLMIGITTFLFSVVGLKIGNVFGNKYKSKAEFTGGVVLVLIGIKILVEHTCM